MIPLVGVVHLAPLPGSPRTTLPLTEIVDRAVADAQAYRDGGATAVIVENFGDAPYFKEAVEPHVVASITLAVERIKVVIDLPVGINVLRNDARAALGIASVTGASFVRVNVHTGVMVTDQGIIEGKADQTLRYRQLLGANTEIWADVHVKHGTPLGDTPIESAAEDAVERGLADALIVTGIGTGKETDPSDVQRVRRQLPNAKIFVGSGVSPDSIARLLPAASGFIVGTWAKELGDVRRPVDVSRVQQLVEAIGTTESRRARS